MDNINIYLESKDIVDRNIMKCIRNVANYFKDPKTDILIEDFCELLTSSGKWDFMDVYDNFLEKRNILEVAYKNCDVAIHKLLKTLEDGFKYAATKNRDFLGDLRGRLFEALLVGIYGGTYILEHPPINEQRGWGVSISLPNKTSTIATESKKTMDYAYIKNENRIFYECKIRPERFGNDEQEYFKVFHDTFEKNLLKHELGLFAADTMTTIEMDLEDEQENFDFPINFLGYDNIKQFIALNK